MHKELLLAMFPKNTHQLLKPGVVTKFYQKHQSKFFFEKLKALIMAHFSFTLEKIYPFLPLATIGPTGIVVGHCFCLPLRRSVRLFILNDVPTLTL